MERPLEEYLEELKRAARLAAQMAYCPYSRFPVGAALLSGENEIFQCCNVENASYGLTNCAERSAIFGAVSRGVTNFKAILIYTPTLIPTAPCGACRQVLNEFAPDAEIISICDGPDSLRVKLPQLLPRPFGPHNL